MLGGKGQQGCISQGKGAQSKGGREGSGGSGKGGTTRVLGTKAFLKNHRRMLKHMKKAGEIELDEAVSAHVEAKFAFTIVGPSRISLQEVWEATQWVNNRELNLDWIAFKQKSLDGGGVYIFTDCQHVVHLTEAEKQ